MGYIFMENVVYFYYSSERNVCLARNPNLPVETLGVDASSPHFVEHIRWLTVRILKHFHANCKVPPTGLTGLSSPDSPVPPILEFLGMFLSSTSLPVSHLALHKFTPRIPLGGSRGFKK